MKQWLDKQVEWLKSFISEVMEDGIQKGSSKRVAQLTVTFVFAFNYTRIALGKEVLPDVPDSWIFLVGVVLGITTIADYFSRQQKDKPKEQATEIKIAEIKADSK